MPAAFESRDDCRPRSRGSGSRASSQPWSNARPGAVNATTLSTWPSVSSSSAMPSASQTTAVDTEPCRRARPRSPTVASRVAVRVEQAALGRHERSRAVDRDRTAFEHERRLRARADRDRAAIARADRRVVGRTASYFSPHALNRKCTAWRGADPSHTTIGPESRIHESSIGAANDLDVGPPSRVRLPRRASSGSTIT